MIIIKPKVNITPLILVFVLCGLLLAFPKNALEGAKNGIEVCLTSLIPSLFPFMVLSTFILQTNALYLPCRLFRGITELLFKLPQNAGQIILMGLIGGYPVGLKMISDSLKKGELTENEAKRLSMFCMNSGPAFTISAIGVGIYKSELLGIVMFISLCISSILIGIFTRFLSDGQSEIKQKVNCPQLSTNAITFSVFNGFEGILKICAWVILFSTITFIITLNFGNTGEIISALLEVTGGCVEIAKRFPISVVTALVGFGGFCVHLQVFEYIKDIGIKYKRFLAGRMVNSALSAAICHIILLVFPIEQKVAYTFSTVNISPVTVSLPTVFAFAFMCISFAFNIDRKEKMC